MIQIYHNPRCGKSRNALTHVENTNKEFEVILYLTQTPTFNDIEVLLQKLALTPIQIVRQKEKIWIEKFKNKQLSDDQIIQAIVDNPILLERPIIINGESAIIARDIVKLQSFIV